MRRSTRDTGMTLTELVITITVLGIVTTVLATTISAFLRNQDDATDRIDRTRGLQQLVNYLPGDVASSQRIETAAPWTNPCSSIGTPILNLVWGEYFPNTDPVTVAVTYVLSSDGGRLVRNHCGPEGRADATLARNLIDAHAQVGTTTDGQVDLVLVFDDGERTIAASSRNR